MGCMRIELLVIPECPHEAAAVESLTTALEDVGLGSVGFDITLIETQVDADLRHFIGSPTICVDGVDLFPEPESPASIACRIYPGTGSVPALRDLRRALKWAAALSASP